MCSRAIGVVLLTLTVLVSFPGGSNADPLKCRAAIVKASAELAQARLKALQTCEASIVKGKLDSSTVCATEPKTSGVISKAEGKLRTAIAAACGGKNKACSLNDTGPNQDDSLTDIGWGSITACSDLEHSGCANSITDCAGIIECLLCASRAPLERAIALSYDGLTFPASKGLQACQQAIGKESAKFFVATSKALGKCWAAVNKGKKGFSAPCPQGDASGKTASAISTAEQKRIAAICKACGGKDKQCDGVDDLSPDTIGFEHTCPDLTVPGGPMCGGAVSSLDALVGCVGCVTSFKATCLDALAAPWGASYPPACNPGCGNGVRESSEACDGADDTDCPGGCRGDCTCGPVPTSVTPTRTPSPTSTPTSKTPTPTGSGAKTSTPTATSTGPTASPTATATPTGAIPATFESSPYDGEDGVAVTRETILRFSKPLDATTINATSIAGSFGGKALAARIEVSSDRKTVTLFYAHLPASARVRVSVNGNLLRDDEGQLVDGDHDSQAGGIGTVAFDTLTLTTLPGTEVHGRVFASELATTARGVAINTPLEGVTISVDGMEDQLSTVTDKDGNFSLEPAPVGRFFVHINGKTAVNDMPPGSYYPFVGKAWESIPGHETDIGNIYLPLIPPDTLQPVSASSDTEIHLPPDVIQQHPEFADVMIKVPADSLFSDDGTRGGMVGIAPVDPDRLPGPLPEGLDLPLVITVQTDGASNFDRPVPVCFPNVPDPALGTTLAPGSPQTLFSFNHDTGNWEPVGPMTVTADGKLICTDSNVGLKAPGWHGVGPIPTSAPPPPCPGCCPAGPTGARDHNLTCHPPSTTTTTSSTTSSTSSTTTTTLPCTRDECLKNCDLVDDGLRAGCHILLLTLTKECLAAVEVPPLAIACELGATAAYYVCLRAADGQTASCNDGCPKCIGSSAKMTTSPISRAAGGHKCSAAQFSNLAARIDELIKPYSSGGTPPAEAWQELASIVSLAEGQVGELDPAREECRAETDASLAQVEDVEGPFNYGEAPANPMRYVAVVRRPSGILRIRGITKPFGSYDLFVPRDGTLLYVALYDPVADLIGFVTPSRRPFAPGGLPYAAMSHASGYPDSDGDGLADVAEDVLGTDARSVDSDGDGVTDGAEISAGTNPIDGLDSLTGILGTADTPGTAVDVCTTNDKVVIADSQEGIALFNVFKGMGPTIIGQIDTGSAAKGVACGRQHAAARLDDGGLAIIDLAAGTPSILYRLPASSFLGTVTAVATAGDVGYVGTQAGNVFSVDLRFGLVLDRVSLGTAIQDLAVDGKTLYAVAGDTLRAVDLSATVLTALGQIATSAGGDPFTGRKRLFVGGGQALVTTASSYDVFNVANPAAMVKVGTATGIGQGSFKQIVANGTGLGVAAVGVNPRAGGEHNVYTYDVSKPAVTTNRQFVFLTPGDAYAVAIHNALAYAADGDKGLQVINYLDFDRGGVPPTVSFTTNASGNRAEEGSTLLVNVAVQDDVQIRNVDLLVDGQIVQTDGSFPFQFFAPVPALDGRPPEQTTFTLAVRATDTGGNSTTTDPVVYAIAQDATSPRVVATSPGAGSVGIGVAAISVRFNEAIDPASVSESAFTLTNFGTDGVPGGGNDTAVGFARVDVPPGDVNDRLVVVLNSPLPAGTYRLRMRKTAVADMAGNKPAADFDLVFGSEPAPPLGTSLWTGPPEGNWNEPGNWSDGKVPAPNARVSIGRPGLTIKVTMGGQGFSSATLQQLTIYGDLTLTSGTLTVTGPSTVSGTIVISPGASLVARGATANFTAPGLATIDAANLTAKDGGRISLPGATHYVHPNFGINATLRAEGTNSLLDLSGLSSLNWGGNSLGIQAAAGGKIDLRNLVTMNSAGGVGIVANGGGVVDLSALVSMTGGSSSLTGQTGGTIIAPQLTSLSGTTLTLDRIGAIPTTQITSFIDGNLTTTKLAIDLSAVTDVRFSSFTVSAPGTLNLDNASVIDATSFTVQGGATLRLPAATSYVHPNFGINATLRAEGTNSLLDLSGLSSLNWGGNSLGIQAAAGGKIDLRNLVTMNSAGGVGIVANTGGVVDLSALVSMTGGSSSLTGQTGGTIVAPQLTSLSGTTLTLDRIGAIPTTQITSFIDGNLTTTQLAIDLSAVTDVSFSSFTVSAPGTLNLDNASDIDATSFTVKSGATLRLPAATSYVHPNFGINATLRAEDAGSTLDLHGVTTLTWGSNSLVVQAAKGGRVDLSGIASANPAIVGFSATGQGSVIDLSSAPIDPRATFTTADGGVILRH